MSTAVSQQSGLAPYWEDPRVNQVFPNGIKISTPRNDNDAASIKALVDLAQLNKDYESEYCNDPETWQKSPYFSLETHKKRCRDRNGHIVFMAKIVLPGSGEETLVGTCFLQSQGTRMVDFRYREIPKLGGVATHPAYNRTYQVAEKIIGTAHSVAMLLRSAHASPESPMCFLYCVGRTGKVRDIYRQKYGYVLVKTEVFEDHVFLEDPSTKKRWNYSYLLARMVISLPPLMPLQALENNQLGTVLAVKEDEYTKKLYAVILSVMQSIRGELCVPNIFQPIFEYANSIK